MLFDPKVAQSIKLSKKQKEALAEIAVQNKEQARRMKDLLSRSRFRSQKAMEEFKKKFSEPAQTRLLAVLKEGQKKHFQTMFTRK